MFSEVINLLKNKNIKFDEGLSELEILKIESIYNFNFPYSLKIFLMENLPISDGFYNWRDLSDDNIAKIKNTMNCVFEYIKSTPVDNYIPNELYYPSRWGEMPEDKNEIRKNFLDHYKNAPKIIPIYLYRFMPILDDNPPILSIYGTDIVYYGRNLQEFIMHEFGKIEIPKNLNEYKYVPFWTDIME